MPRPKKKRCIRCAPVSTSYKPGGVAPQEMKGVTLPLEGFEALRLVDAEGTSREEAAQMMNVSTPTLCRILAEGRRIVARALANGWALHIEGGDYMIADVEDRNNCATAHHCRRRNRGKKTTD